MRVQGDAAPVGRWSIDVVVAVRSRPRAMVRIGDGKSDGTGSGVSVLAGVDACICIHCAAVGGGGVQRTLKVLPAMMDSIVHHPGTEAMSTLVESLSVCG
ncbi:hypothetical protein [Nocardia salmonicida]|uniref:hypothetical protein n=1 Tax=Nocardia salmonicida TaxID=53431 RepID=UPI0033E5009F